MKLISWNVNGLRACMQKGFLDAFHDFDADFVCIQETKLQEGQIELSIPGYLQFWNYAEKNKGQKRRRSHTRTQYILAQDPSSSN